MDEFKHQREFLNKFTQIAEERQAEYKDAQPFSHITLDNILSPELVDSILAEFPGNDDKIWDRQANQGIQVKLRSNWKSDEDIAPNTRKVVHMFNSGPFLRSLAKLTGVSNLIADPYYTGGGLNCILTGGHLAVHCDGNWHDDMAVHRRLNVILYLNKNWQEEWGGHLELWDKDLKGCVKKVAPLCNRLFIFTTHDYTFHGHPEPLKCPEGESRKSLIFYYYTSRPRPAEEVADSGVHRALWQNVKY
jgi:Rps23 Pro-64 3,4-dihydroxylase Tpa1-like proline 4-hydroxylase